MIRSVPTLLHKLAILAALLLWLAMPAFADFGAQAGAEHVHGQDIAASDHGSHAGATDGPTAMTRRVS